MDLRDDQFEQVSLLVNRSVSMHSLRVELLDHLCCYIEAQLDLGISFEAALNEAILQLSPEGLTAVEERTVVVVPDCVIVFVGCFVGSGDLDSDDDADAVL